MAITKAMIAMKVSLARFVGILWCRLVLVRDIVTIALIVYAVCMLTERSLAIAVLYFAAESWRQLACG